ncbi:MAG: RNA polymerase sigma factor, partial [Nitrospinota bacterium]
MESFLVSVERQAYRMAEIGTGSSEEALDIVQEAMFGFVRKYSDRPDDEWRPLFFRILQNKIRDWHRKAKIRKGLGLFWPFNKSDEESSIQDLPDAKEADAATVMESSDSIEAMHAAIGALPLRQQQAFLLRAWEEFSVKETAEIMEVSEGSVKTHFSRAITALRESLK